MADRNQSDDVWEHGVNEYPGWTCKYCKTSKKGGGANRFKHHLAGRGANVRSCNHVPQDVREYYRRQLDRIVDKKKERQREELRRVEVAREGNVVDDDDVELLEHVINLSRQEATYQNRVREEGGSYEHGGGSSSQPPAGGGSSQSRGGGLVGMLRRSMSTKGKGEKVQTRIDTGPFSPKHKSAKAAIGKAWSKWFHIEAITGRKTDNPYFKAAIKETQRWGEGIASPIERDIDGVYLDENEVDIKKQFEKFKLDWPTYGVTLMCDSWTGPTGMSIINFMVYCNGITYFHKSVNATGYMQDAKFIAAQIDKVVKELGSEHIIQIITDNGSNYKVACKALQKHYNIVWQPCLAHTINLMLKNIGDFVDHKTMIEAARRICRWFYNHNRLHSMMRTAIGGELVRWNATRFGTNYMFLESMLRRKDQFMVWMSSQPFSQSSYANTDEGRYAHNCLSSLSWWDSMKDVVKSVEPLYAFLRFADQDKVPTLSEVLLRFHLLCQEYESIFQGRPRELDKYLEVIRRRMGSATNHSYINAAAALNPRTHYEFATGQNVLNDLRGAFEWMTDTNTCVQALHEAETYRRKLGSFSSDLANRMACAPNTSPSQWWAMFGSDTPTLQKLALRLVSQCCSSSGCERNWSTFALIHTKVRNILSYQKLHKLVYVNYNLRIRLRQAEMYMAPEDDPFSRLMELSLYDSSNPVRDWMEHVRFNAAPLLDDDSTDSDTDIPLPSGLVVQGDTPAELRQITGTSSLREWAARTVGDTHIGKRKAMSKTTKSKKQKKAVESKGKKKKTSKKQVDSDDDDSEPPYQESDDSSSPPSSDGNSGGQHPTTEPPPTHIEFTGEANFEYATQDQDHCAPRSQRVTITESAPSPTRGRQHHLGTYNSPQASNSSYSACSSSPYAHGADSYLAPPPDMRQTPNWVYEWQDPDFYNLLYSEWQTTAAWTGQTWNDYKAALLATRGIALMSTEEYNAAWHAMPWS